MLKDTKYSNVFFCRHFTFFIFFLQIYDFYIDNMVTDWKFIVLIVVFLKLFYGQFVLDFI